MDALTLLRLASIPIVSALIGWFTNFIAVRMLFHPRKPWPQSFPKSLQIQGLLPKRQSELARKVGETIEDRLISIQDVLSKLNNSDLESKIAPIIRETIDAIVQKHLQQIPMLGMFLQRETLNQIKGMLVKETLTALPRIIQELSNSLEETVKFKAIIQERIEKFDLSVLEEIVNDISGSELRAIEFLGGVLGFFIGLIQVALVIL